jgi:acetyltransferase
MVLTEDRVKQEMPWLPHPRHRMAASAAEAAETARSIGFPVALKIISVGVPHRARVGGLALGLMSETAVVEAYDRILGKTREAVPGVVIDGVLVQAMVEAGPEILLGMHRDPTFGPVAVLGLGGTLAESVRHVTFAAAPLDTERAEALVASLPSLSAWCGPHDHESLSEIVTKASYWFIDRAAIELDLNPIVITPGGPIAVDALAVVADLG